MSKIEAEFQAILTAEKSNLAVPPAAVPSFPVNPVKLGTVVDLLVATAGGFGPAKDVKRGGGTLPGRRPVK